MGTVMSMAYVAEELARRYSQGSHTRIEEVCDSSGAEYVDWWDRRIDLSYWD